MKTMWRMPWGTLACVLGSALSWFACGLDLARHEFWWAIANALFGAGGTLMTAITVIELWRSLRRLDRLAKDFTTEAK